MFLKPPKSAYSLYKKIKSDLKRYHNNELSYSMQCISRIDFINNTVTITVELDSFNVFDDVTLHLRRLLNMMYATHNLEFYYEFIENYTPIEQKKN